MNITQATELVAMLQVAWPRHAWNDQSPTVYHLGLEDLDGSTVLALVPELIRTCTFAPTVAEIRALMPPGGGATGLIYEPAPQPPERRIADLERWREKGIITEDDARDQIEAVQASMDDAMLPPVVEPKAIDRWTR